MKVYVLLLAKYPGEKEIVSIFGHPQVARETMLEMEKTRPEDIFYVETHEIK